tara:strand:+ start:4851 stop:5186 length:336 start_codon:yes stop_codon:yes gene_type:complete
MGLDQYAFSREPQTSIPAFIWRKHPNLQEFMCNVWYEQGNEGEFNCKQVQIDTEILDRLENDVKKEQLPEGGGFFHGSNSDEHYKETDLEFIKWARKEIADGQEVFYDSWW